MTKNEQTFIGFPSPTKNFFSLPNEMINIIAHIKNMAELKVIIYVIRHTWGFHEYGISKAISTDGFMHGRRRQDGSRMDEGTGLSNRSVIDGLRDAEEHGYLICEVDTSDRARTVKSYKLKMASNAYEDTSQGEESSQGIDASQPPMKKVHSPYEEASYQREDTSHRSEKDTLEKHLDRQEEKQESVTASDDALSLLPSDQKEQVRQKLDSDPRLKAITKDMLASQDVTLDTNDTQFHIDNSATCLESKGYMTSDFVEEEDITDEPTERLAIIKKSASTAIPLPLAAIATSSDRHGDASAQAIPVPPVSPPGQAALASRTLTSTPGSTSVEARANTSGFRITKAPTSNPVTQVPMNLHEAPDFSQMSEQQLRNLDKQANERRAEEIWVIVEHELGTTFNPSHRRKKPNIQGMSSLTEDCITDEKLVIALQALDQYQLAHFNLENFHGWIPGLTATRKPHQNGSNGKQSQQEQVIVRPANTVRSFNGIAARQTANS